MMVACVLDVVPPEVEPPEAEAVLTGTLRLDTVPPDVLPPDAEAFCVVIAVPVPPDVEPPLAVAFCV